MAHALSDPSSAAVARAGSRVRLRVRDCLRWLGSVHAAVALLSLFAGVLFLGTLVESWYDSAVAHQLVYQTWWFVLLLALLGGNIFFAAVKKWPWKKHQTGFLITHVGLLTLVAGGLVNALAGVQGSLVLVDAEGASAAHIGLHSSNVLIDRRTHILRVQRHTQELLREALAPGPLAWHPDRHDGPQVGGLTAVLNWLAHPARRGWSRSLPDGARLEVIDFLPHARQEPFAPAEAGAASFPALQVQLSSAETGPLPPRWLGFDQEQRSTRWGPGLVELLGRNCRPEQVQEFRQPPPPDQVGPKGQLVLYLAGDVHRLDVHAVLAQGRTDLASTGWSLRVLQFLPNFARESDPRPLNPALSFELSRADGATASLVTGARQAGEAYALPKTSVPWQALGDFWVWYHPPDPRYGESTIRAVLQFLAGADGRLWYRSFSSARNEGFGLENAGEVAQGTPQRIWKGMNWRFQVSEFLPHAAPGPRFRPVQGRPAVDEPNLVPAIRCRLTHRGHSEEFWLGKTEGGGTRVVVAGEQFLVGYHDALHALDFTLTLQRAEQTTDRGSQQPASQSSFVRLSDPGIRLYDQPRVITLNQPLAHGGYRFYQAGYQPLGLDVNGRLVSRSVLTVTSDPGLWLKYAGSSMVALGIACMFYMKAYFFKPRSRSPAA